jgi:hypothetical protein
MQNASVGRDDQPEDAPLWRRTFYTDRHSELDMIVLFQNGDGDSGTLIEVGKFLPGDVV